MLLLELQMSTLQLPTGENILMSAFRAVEEGRNATPTDLVAEYEKYFTTTLPSKPTQAQKFERFSLSDPNIRVIVQSNTVPN